MAEQDPKVREALDGLDTGKRETLTKLISGSAFVAPIVASFAMQGISIRPAEAAPGSSSNQTIISDVRLKRDITQVGTHPLGFGVYRFKYLWSATAYVGVLAQDAVEKVPHAVSTGPGNFLAVNYAALGMAMTHA